MAIIACKSCMKKYLCKKSIVQVCCGPRNRAAIILISDNWSFRKLLKLKPCTMPKAKLQNPTDFSGQKFYVGIDVHKNSWSVTIRSLNLHIEHFSQPPSVKALVNHLQRKYPGGEYYSAYEAGFCGTGIHEELCKAGVSNTIVHAADIPFTDKQNKS